MKKVLTIVFISTIMVLLLGCPPTTDGGGDPALQPVNADTPMFSGELANVIYVINVPATPLNGTATVTDNGTLSYQWYKNTSNSNQNGEPISGATNATYIPPTNVAGTSYYYVVATNIIDDNNGGGQKTATKVSTVAKITIDTKIYRVKRTLNGKELTISPDYEGSFTDSNFVSMVKGVPSSDKEAITKVIISVPEGATIIPETNLDNLFGSSYGLTRYTRLTEIVGLEYLDTSSVTTMNYMFTDCSSLESLDLSSFDTSLVNSMTNIFDGCSSLESLNLSSFDTSLITGMDRMFRGCSALTSLDLSSFDTSNVKRTDHMFSDCTAIEEAYGRTETDCTSFNSSSNKPSNVNFIVKKHK